MPWICHDFATRLQRIFLVTNDWLIMLARCWSKGMLKSCCGIYINPAKTMFSYISFRYASTHFHEFPMKLSNYFLWFSRNFPLNQTNVFLWFANGFPWNFYTSMAKDATGRSKTARVHSLVTWYQQTWWFCFIWVLCGFIAQKRLFYMVLYVSCGI